MINEAFLIFVSELVVDSGFNRITLLGEVSILVHFKIALRLVTLKIALKDSEGAPVTMEFFRVTVAQLYVFLGLFEDLRWFEPHLCSNLNVVLTRLSLLLLRIYMPSHVVIVDFVSANRTLINAALAIKL